MKKHLTEFLRRGARVVFLVAGLIARADDARNFEALVIRVHDGDTMTVKREDGTQTTIRLATVDAPELRQPGGAEAQRWLAAQTLALHVRVQWVNGDRYGRTVALIFRAQTNIALDAVKNGHAWVYRAYIGFLNARDRTEILEAETTARKTKTGLWSESKPLEPWIWRSLSRAHQALPVPDAP